MVIQAHTNYPPPPKHSSQSDPLTMFHRIEFTQQWCRKIRPYKGFKRCLKVIFRKCFEGTRCTRISSIIVKGKISTMVSSLLPFKFHWSLCWAGFIKHEKGTEIGNVQLAQINFHILIRFFSWSYIGKLC